jgi:aldehyde dehydrogenase (NAD+)
MIMVKNFKNYIDGQWVDPVSGNIFENINPSNISEVLGYFPRSTKDDVDKAVSAALVAFNEWKNTPAPQRAEVLYEAARIMSGRREELARVISSENGKTVKSSLGEVQSGIDMANFIAGEGRRMYGKTTHSGLKKRFAMTKRYPIGVIGIILPFNFPLALASWRVFPALICGNTVVLKADENSPETSVHFVKMLEEAGLPKGVLNLIHGFGTEVGEPLTLHPDVSMVSFTGSSAVGKIVAKNCVNRHAKVSLELGGKNAVIVMDDADLDLAVDGVVCGTFSVSGQRCTATSRVIVHNGVYDEFMKRLLGRTKALKIGPAYEDTSDVTPLINKKQLDRTLGFIERAKRDGAKILAGGEQLRGGLYDNGYYVAPAIIDNVTLEMEIAQEEVFGPVLVVLKAGSYEEAIRMHNSSPYGLSASLFTKDVNKAMSFFDDAEAGVCYINAPTFGSEPHMPFGGVKHSGRGYREVGWAAIETYSEVKTLYIDYSARIQNVQFVDKSEKE